jgi:glycosyltransferase 2 family protein
VRERRRRVAAITVCVQRRSCSSLAPTYHVPPMPSADDTRASRAEGASARGPRLGRALAAGMLLALVLYAGLAVWGDLGKINVELRAFPVGLFVLACALSFTNYLVRFVRWQRYLAVLGIELDRKTSFTIHLAGLALTVSPGKMGEAFKSLLIRRVRGTPLALSAPIVLAERFTDLLGFLVLIVIGGLATSPEQAWIFWSTSVLCAALVFLATSRAAQSFCLERARAWRPLARIVPKLEAALESTRRLFAPRELFWPTLLATLGWGLECLGFWLVASAFVDGGVPFLFAVYTFALSAVAGAVLILFPGGLGPTEASMGALLRREYMGAGVLPELAAAKAVTATLVIRAATLWFAVLVGLIATLVFKRRHGGLT